MPAGKTTNDKLSRGYTMRIETIVSAIAAGGLIGFALVVHAAEQGSTVATGERRHVVLVGASIGKSWNLPELPARLNNNNYSFEALQVWEYDKSQAVEETLIRPARKFKWNASYVKGFFQPAPELPDLVILKECSSYFGGDAQLARKKDLFQRWVQQVRDKKIPVMVTTVAPITRERAQRDGLGKQQAIREFNDWIRRYAAEQGLVVVDLEKALRADDGERFLRDDLTSGDGSHLNRKAYDILDRVMAQALCEHDKGSCRQQDARL